MKKIICLISLFFSLNLFAAQINFTYFGNQGSNQSFYSCDYVEDQATQYLEVFGATNIDLFCTGGITNWSWSPVSLRASFDLPVVTGNNFEEVRIAGDVWSPACGLNTIIIREILKSFKSVKVLEKQYHCAFADSNFYYLLQIPR
jgi:hypothetical protein